MKFQKSEEINILIRDCINNNRTAQKMLYEKYKDAMFSICYRILGNYNDASDALQDGFINVFNNIEKFKGKSTLGAWIKTIIVRAALLRIPKNNFEDLSMIEQETKYEIDDSLTGEVIEKAILELNSGYRTVFNLIEIEGYKHYEVAEMLGISIGTSKSQLFKAKKVLRAKLQILNSN